MSTLEGPPVPTPSPQPELHDGNYNPVSTLLDAYRDWMDDARCLDADPDTFFPDKGGSTREAKRICDRCTVREDCLAYAMANEERYGIWGGMSERERRRLRRIANARPTPAAPGNGHRRPEPDRTADRDRQIVDAIDSGVNPARVADRHDLELADIYRAIRRVRQEAN